MSTATAERNGHATPTAPSVPGTRHRGIFDRLAAPFSDKQVKYLTKGGKQLAHITARTAMNRLDEVLGPENWEDEYYEKCGVLFCKLTITLPDGRRVTKSDAGGFRAMVGQGGKVDEESTNKTGASSAFKRTAAKFGVARYLYRDGVADLEPPVVAQNNTGHGRGSYMSPKDEAAYRKVVGDFIAKFNAAFFDRWTSRSGVATPGLKEPIDNFRVNGHMLKWAMETGVGDLDPGLERGGITVVQKERYNAIVYFRDKAGFRSELARYARQCETTEATRWRKANPDAEPDCSGFEAMVEAEQEAADQAIDSEITSPGRQPGED